MSMFTSAIRLSGVAEEISLSSPAGLSREAVQTILPSRQAPHHPVRSSSVATLSRSLRHPAQLSRIDRRRRARIVTRDRSVVQTQELMSTRSIHSLGVSLLISRHYGNEAGQSERATFPCDVSRPAN